MLRAKDRSKHLQKAKLPLIKVAKLLNKEHKLTLTISVKLTTRKLQLDISLAILTVELRSISN